MTRWALWRFWVSRERCRYIQVTGGALVSGWARRQQRHGFIRPGVPLKVLAADMEKVEFDVDLKHLYI